MQDDTRHGHLLYVTIWWYLLGLIFSCFQMQELTNSAAEYAQSWLRRAKEAARQGKHLGSKLGKRCYCDVLFICSISCYTRVDSDGGLFLQLETVINSMLL